MKKLMTSFIALLLLSSTFAATEVLVVELDIASNNTVTLNDYRLMSGSETVAETTEYSLVQLSSDGEVLHTTYFDVVFTAYGDNYPFLPGQEDVGVSVELNETRVIVRTPYYSNAASFEVRKNSTVLLQQSISLCNNDGTCDVSNGENFLSCPADCPSGGSDDLCDGVFDGTCDPDCEAQGRSDRDTDCTCGDGTCNPREDSITCPEDCGAASNEITNMITMIIGAGVGIIAAIIIVIVLVIKKVRKKKK